MNPLEPLRGRRLPGRNIIGGKRADRPVHVPGALFQVSDGHADHGDGEIDFTALETSLSGTLRSFVRKGLCLSEPRAETPRNRAVCLVMDPFDSLRRRLDDRAGAVDHPGRLDRLSAVREGLNVAFFGDSSGEVFSDLKACDRRAVLMRVRRREAPEAAGSSRRAKGVAYRNAWKANH